MFGVWGFRFGVWGFRFGIQGSGFRVQDLGFEFWVLRGTLELPVSQLHHDLKGRAKITKI